MKPVEIQGGCHCGAVRFRALVPEGLQKVLACNCSICSMTGFLHLMVPHGDFEMLTDPDALASYRFGSGAAEHLFCSVCGVKSFYQPRSHPECWSVNANCVDPPLNLTIDQFDGRNWDQAKARLDGE